MKALILSGGFGTRLRPLTCTRPKLLLPVAGKTILEHIIESYPFDEIILAVNWLSDKIEDFIAKNEWENVIVCHEETPLGTAGAIKNAEKFLNDTFIVFNGDVLSSLQLEAFINFHKKKGAFATDALFPVSDVERFGVAELKGEKIVRFVEKPSLNEAPSNLINAGVYCFEPTILDFIESGKRISLEREIFPTIATKGDLYGYPFQGLWFDIGRPTDYIKANLGLLKNGENLIHSSSKTSGRLGKIIVGKECVIVNSQIEDSVILDNTNISNSFIFNSIIANNAKVSNAFLDECIIGDSTVIEGRWYKKKVCPGEELKWSHAFG
jgi:mannose-1-phosphate guanylyltransferase